RQTPLLANVTVGGSHPLADLSAPSAAAVRQCLLIGLRLHDRNAEMADAFLRYLDKPERLQMKMLIPIAVGALLLGSPALAEGSAQIMTSVPAQSTTVKDWYKQSVYDPSNNKIGEIEDVLLSPEGKVNALIVGVGGFLGMGEKDVAIPFGAVKHTTRDGKVYLTLDTTKDALKAAPGLKYDRASTTWVPEKS